MSIVIGAGVADSIGAREVVVSNRRVAVVCCVGSMSVISAGMAGYIVEKSGVIVGGTNCITEGVDCNVG